MMKLPGAKSRSTVMRFGAKSSRGANLFKENRFSVFYIFDIIELRLLLSNGLIVEFILLEVTGG